MVEGLRQSPPELMRSRNRTVSATKSTPSSTAILTGIKPVVAGAPVRGARVAGLITTVSRSPQKGAKQPSKPVGGRRSYSVREPSALPFGIPRRGSASISQPPLRPLAWRGSVAIPLSPRKGCVPARICSTENSSTQAVISRVHPWSIRHHRAREQSQAKRARH